MLEQEQRTCDELARSIAGKEKQIERLLKELRDARIEGQNLNEQLGKITNSTSWRITRPIRLVAESLRMIRPVYRNRVVNAIPGNSQSLKSVDERFVVCGPSPFLELKLDKEAPSGWTKINSDIICDNGVFCCMLYFRLGETFDASHRVWVTLNNNDRHPIIINLPEGTKGIRLDPFDAEESFQFRSLSFKEIGSLNFLIILLRRIVQELKENPKALFLRVRRAFGIIKKEGTKGLLRRLLPNRQSHDYAQWVHNYDDVKDKDLPIMQRASEKLDYKPLISVIMPTYNSPETYLRKAIDSVIDQAYSNWELCIADDNSTNTEIKRLLKDYTSRDSRIKVVFREKNGHIAEATNSALELATGDYIAFLDHDDELTKDALLIVANSINKNPKAALFYSDEDKKSEDGLRFNPYFKTDFNPELLLSQNYFCHLSVYRRSIVDKLGGLRKGYDGAQDWDLALRVIDAIDEQNIDLFGEKLVNRSDTGGVVHIPHILYHWRVIEGSTAQSTGCKPYVLEAQKRSVEDHLIRRKESATVEIDHQISQLKVTFHIPTPEPRISLIIPTRDMTSVLRTCVDSILERTRYNAYDIIIVDNGSVEDDTFNYFKIITKTGKVKILRDDGPFNFSRLNNNAVKSVTTPLIGLINNDLETIEDTWLDHLISHAIRPKVGAVGARLYFPNDLLQHAGIIMGIGGVAGHSHKGRPRGDVGYFNRIILPQSVSGVTGACLVMRRAVFDEVGGLDDINLQVAFNDVDLCLKIRDKGYRIVYQPYAELYHHESASRGSETTPEKFNRFEREIGWMKQKWGEKLRRDPFYNPNLTLLTEDYGFATPPRELRFWRLIDNS